MRVLFVNQYFEPDVAASGLLAADICDALALRDGWEVHVVCGQPNYTRDAQPAAEVERRGALTIHRLPMRGATGKSSMKSRVLGYLRFLRAAKRKCFQLTSETRFDVVMTMTNPPFVGAIGAKLKRRGIRFVYAVHDIHPDVLVATGWGGIPRPLLAWWERWSRRMLSHADRVIVLGNGMKRTLVDEKGADANRIHVIPLWGRPEIDRSPPDENVRDSLGIDESKTLVLLAGNLGVMHPLDPILDAAKRLPHTHFVFLGEGEKKPALEARVDSEKIANVQLLTYQPERRFADFVKAADLCVVTLEPGLEGLAVPSRSFTFLSAGKPLLTVMSPSADVAEICAEEGCGWNVSNADELVEKLSSLTREELRSAGERACAVYDARFRREMIVDLYAQALMPLDR